MRLNRTLISVMICAAAVCSCKQAAELTPVNGGDNDKPAIDETADPIGATLEQSAKTSLMIDGNKGYVLWNKLTDTTLINGSRYVATEILDDKGTTAKLCLVEGDTDISKDESYEAYYPASICKTGTTKLPAVQKFKAVADGADAKVTGDISAIMPMYGEGSNKSVQFYNILGLLEITLKADAKVKKIEVSDKTLGMCGEFTVDDDKNAVLTTPTSKLPVTLDCGEDGVDITSGVKFYVAIPAGIYTDFEIKVYDINDKVCDLPAFGDAEVLRNEIYALEFEPVFVKNSLLPGKFSVSADKYVQFSRGNLYCTRDSESGPYHFDLEMNQYDYRCRSGETSDKAVIMGTETTTPQATSGLFEWIPRTNPNATADWSAFTKHKSPVSGNTTSDVLDFGGVFSTGGWTTLSSVEWQYLLDKSKYKITTVNGVKGLCIAPDNYDSEIATSYTLDQWKTEEAAGMVFLPYYGYFNPGTNSIVTGEACYWSSTADSTTENYAQSLKFYNTGNSIQVAERWRNYAQYVRLVQRFSK
ncbi:MAG: hypothetical protein KBT32_11600 [Bacteroidales bacterium]|nr:hypothetical protein [Candidatus Physcocola equi]